LEDAINSEIAKMNIENAYSILFLSGSPSINNLVTIYNNAIATVSEKYVGCMALAFSKVVRMK
jgi:hypothetical protein